MLCAIHHRDRLLSLSFQGFGWAIAKALAEAGAEISLGVWVSLEEELYQGEISAKLYFWLAIQLHNSSPS